MTFGMERGEANKDYQDFCLPGQEYRKSKHQPHKNF